MAEAIRHDKTARQLRLLSDALDSGRLGPVRRLVHTLAPAEIGNLLESLPHDKRIVVWGLVDPEDDGEADPHDQPDAQAEAASAEGAPHGGVGTTDRHRRHGRPPPVSAPPRPAGAPRLPSIGTVPLLS